MKNDQVPKPADVESFEDPLENYEPKVYEDPVEQALADQPVTAIQATPVATIPVTATVREAVEKLASLKVACLLVEDKGRLVGVFTDRDVLDLVVLEIDAMANKSVREVMVEDPAIVYDTNSSAAALSVMAFVGCRHVPVLNAQEEIVGIVSPQRVTAFLTQHYGGKA